MNPIALEALTVRYGQRLALDQVSLDIPEGSVYALLGRNGAGKSSLVRCLLGGQKPTSGRALVLAFNKWDLIDDERRRYLEREIEQDLAHVSWAPRVNISALTGRHLEKLVPALTAALDGWDTRIPTGKFNAFLAELTAAGS